MYGVFIGKRFINVTGNQKNQVAAAFHTYRMADVFNEKLALTESSYT